MSFKKLLFLPLLFLMIFSSCQKEAAEITDPNNDETLVADSNLTNLMRFTATNDGSFDNIIDFANCLEVQLPVTVIVDDITITINSFEDLDLIEDIFDEFDDDEDSLEIIFPITIISADYTEIVIENQEALEALIDECHGEDEEDDDIECIDFQYPITISIYNTDFEIIDTVTINSDEALYDFIDDLEGSVLASLNFPITMVLSDGSTLVVENNTELEAAIEAAEDECDEDDDYDWDDDDDDIEDCDINLAGLEGYMLECSMEAYIYDALGNIIDENYLDFNADAEVIVNGTPAVTEVGTWELSESTDGYVLTINGLVTFDLLNGEWLLEGCDDDGFVWSQETGSGVYTMELEQDCSTSVDCNVEEVETSLVECFWIAETNLFDIFVQEDVYFLTDGTVEIYNSVSGNLTTTGTWTVTSDSGSLYLNLELNEEPFSMLNVSWEMISCDSDRFEFVNGDDTLLLEQDCRTDENPFDCFDNATITICDDSTVDGFAEFDLEALYLDLIDCDVDYNVSLHETGSDAETNSNAIASPSNYLNTTNPQTIYVRVEALDGDYEIYEIQLIVEACVGSCTAEGIGVYLESCLWFVVDYDGNGDLVVWDFNFNSDGSVVVTGEGMSVTAGWSTTETGEGVVLSLTGIALADIQVVEGEWLVTECNEGRMVFRNSDAVTIMVMERGC